MVVLDVIFVFVFVLGGDMFFIFVFFIIVMFSLVKSGLVLLVMLFWR